MIWQITVLLICRRGYKTWNSKGGFIYYWRRKELFNLNLDKIGIFFNFEHNLLFFVYELVCLLFVYIWGICLLLLT